MIVANLCLNPNEITEIITNETLYKAVSPANSPNPENIIPDFNKYVYLIYKDLEKKTYGLSYLSPFTNSIVIGHINILPEFWGCFLKAE